MGSRWAHATSHCFPCLSDVWPFHCFPCLSDVWPLGRTPPLKDSKVEREHVRARSDSKVEIERFLSARSCLGPGDVATDDQLEDLLEIQSFVSADDLEVMHPRIERFVTANFDPIDGDDLNESGADSAGLAFVRAASSHAVPRKTSAQIASEYGVPLEALQELEAEFAESLPVAQLARFLAKKSVSGDRSKASNFARGYLKWRSEIPQWPPTPSEFPQPFVFNGFAKDGSRLMMLLPCVISTGFKPEIYSHALVRLLDAEIDPADTLRLTVLLDCRGHHSLGCPAEPIWKLWSYVKCLAKVFQSNYPERLQRFVIYPAGSVEMGAFRTLKWLFSQETLKRVALLYDERGNSAESPPAELLEYIDTKEIRAEHRKFFKGMCTEES